MVNTTPSLEQQARDVLRRILEDECGLRVDSRAVRAAGDRRYDLSVTATSGKASFRLSVELRSRITPQIAVDVCQRLRGIPFEQIPVFYSPVVSKRVADIATEQEVGYVDGAGNCRLQSRDRRLLIERRGFLVEHPPTSAAADPFSPKSSRIVRALLAEPKQGWQVRELATHPEVLVSPALVVKVKRKLIEEGYAVLHDKLLYLRDPVGLLNDWSAKYPGPAEQMPLYFRGDVEAAERSTLEWCHKNGLRCALAGFSAAWRLAPEVRYKVGAVYVEERGFQQPLLDRLATDHGGKGVESGGNLILWRPFDRSVFAFGGQPTGVQPLTSALQTYLDLNRMAGRGEDAAKSVFEKCLITELRAAAERSKDWPHGEV